MNDIDYKAEIEKKNQELDKELNLWDELGVEPNQVIIHNLMNTDVRIKTLMKFLANKGIIDEDEYVLYFKEQMLISLQEIREKVTPEIRKARLQASGIELPNMTIPQSKLRKMH